MAQNPLVQTQNIVAQGLRNIDIKIVRIISKLPIMKCVGIPLYLRLLRIRSCRLQLTLGTANAQKQKMLPLLLFLLSHLFL
jgi:hypothetical protein